MKIGIAKPDSLRLRLGCTLFLLDNIDETNMKYSEPEKQDRHNIDT